MPDARPPVRPFAAWCAATRRRAILAMLALGAPGVLPAQPPSPRADATVLGAFVDRTLARGVAAGGPGCTIGVQLGDLVVDRAAGQADLERTAALTPASILEAGSVSKQVTAAAVLLLALDGQVELDADVRRWFPELPAYERPITVRHLLTHTSGLRDWGSIVQLEGWPRGARAHTNAHVVQVAARQRALNYPPGDAYSYTNTGYNLLAELVQRVSGRSLAAFTRERLFTPLGMTSTSWRDDHRRVVPGRALAYGGGSVPSLNMPDESAYGNGGLLTTVGDLLRWTDAMNRRTLGAAFADSLVRRMVLTGGDTIDYALGVNVVDHRGTRELSHSGLSRAPAALPRAAGGRGGAVQWRRPERHPARRAVGRQCDRSARAAAAGARHGHASRRRRRRCAARSAGRVRGAHRDVRQRRRARGAVRGGARVGGAGAASGAVHAPRAHPRSRGRVRGRWPAALVRP
jgi:CubicO group peptidase (beta-lactamase class C family)